MNCIKCKDEIDARRLKALPQTKVCVNCSTTEAVSCVDITYHKTGNTIHLLFFLLILNLYKIYVTAGVPISKVNKLGCGSPHKPSACFKNSTILKITRCNLETS